MRDVGRIDDIKFLAHDVRGLLACIQLEIDALARTADDFTRIRASSLQRATDRLVEYCASVSGRSYDDAHITSTRLARILSDAASLLLFEGSHYGIDVECSGDCAPLMPGEGASIHRMAINLGRNAIAAMRQRGYGRISIESKLLAESFRIDVADNGPGLPESVLNHLFPRLDKPSAPLGRVGLGIASTRRLAQLAGGDLYLLRSDSRGAAFRIVLPLRANTPSPQMLKLVVSDTAKDRVETHP